MEKHLLLKLARSDFHKDFHRSNGDLLPRFVGLGRVKALGFGRFLFVYPNGIKNITGSCQT